MFLKQRGRYYIVSAIFCWYSCDLCMFASWLSSLVGSKLKMYLNLPVSTVGGINPTPPGIYKTISNLLHNGLNYLSTGARFPPSTVLKRLLHTTAPRFFPCDEVGIQLKSFCSDASQFLEPPDGQRMLKSRNHLSTLFRFVVVVVVVVGGGGGGGVVVVVGGGGGVVVVVVVVQLSFLLFTPNHSLWKINGAFTNLLGSYSSMQYPLIVN